ncbi:unnamed protein product [Prorocentrum cordatum]|uniref:Mitochondrial fission process protein 1 n=1 Tax=Prorocentrum cordatum TaxID=2364126 RepID=A0ABN9VU67_9DINO|nr:unnamed protein product [Polarella glacialis]
MAAGPAATAPARALLGEFAPWVRRYNAGAALLGVAFGAWDAPEMRGRAPGAASPEAAAPDGPGAGMAPASAPAPGGAGAVAGPPRGAAAAAAELPAAPRELGLWRTALLTAPGAALALQLGRRAREIGAPPSALALAALPSLSCPLLLYLLGGYPTGAVLRAWYDGRLPRPQ